MANTPNIILMQFQTKITIPKYPIQIQPSDNILSIGSCFSENIGKKLLDHKFYVSNNPFGTLFNPLSIAKTLDASLSGVEVIIDEVHQHQDVFFHFDHHSVFNALNVDDVVSKINSQRIATNQFLQKSDWLIITLGTSIVYRYNDSGEVVANCHKVPQKEFIREFLSVETMVNALKNSITTFKNIRRKANIILTVSPIRHTKEGIVDNNRSKARLIEVCHQLQNDTDIFYFPSYEIMMDELRDYRFYADDMIHPSTMAIEYIWQAFSESLLSENSQQKLKSVSKILKMEQHRPFNPDSVAHLKFLAKLESEKERIQSIYPEVKF